jgi:hypothetical protein
MALQPPDNLLRARRALDELPFYELVADWAWNEAVKKWVLQCRLTVKAGGLIPAKTDWFILADADYPWGGIELHPAKEGGLTHTFHHQSYNAVGNAELPWRDGKICAQTSMRYVGRRAYDIEPLSVDERLLWRMIRAREWLEAAAAGRLAEKGEPFELPDFPKESVEGLGFVEDEESFRFWQQQSLTFGVATMVQPEGVDRWAVVASYSDERDRIIRSIEYGAMLSQRSVRKASAIWVRSSGVPVLSPWQAPATFGELRSVLTEQGVDFNVLVPRLAPRFRDGKSHLLLLGFPIPAVVGGERRMYHWQGLRLPIISHGKLNGFRPIETNYARNDVQKVLADNVRIDWVTSRNWAEVQIRTRGRASPQLADARVLLVGGGALGSSVAELLVREGCKRLTVVDGDILDVGNLCRHTLSLRHVCEPKADSLADRLNSISPHATVRAIGRGFHERTNAEQQQMAECDIIIDCTGDDRVVHQLGTFPWSGNKLFVSASLGLQARRLFLFVAQGKSFPHAEFVSAVTPWLHKELKEYEGLELRREGIGCWHPVFPACSDDVWLMGAVAAKCIDSWAANPPRSPRMNVYEQDQKGGLFAGVRLVAES